ncbi:hypothetical protein [Streptomyces sp. V3I7]|uniref:hypothetical protein n=1 Tax=Streptomyces sp. V3I7 TaxID=3042278 RepID=UPI0027853B27|nr:hypothetical protein [Streptomyces sp. V3I7]MDQ0993608.1 hypothetical protein [Streptomyces sp. V3I7]
MPTARTVLTATVAATALLGCAVAPAAALADPPQPPRHLSKLIRGGADGRPHEVFCPSMQHIYSGGFTLTAASGTRLSTEPADVLESRPNDHATGWIVTVRKAQVWRYRHHRSGPADLTVHLACTDDTMMHGA